jgi:hypothetical protein
VSENHNMPKSKESRQKLRRWSYMAEMNVAGVKQNFKMPGITYGNSSEAALVGVKLLEQFNLDPSMTAEARVVPIAHETISLTTKTQFTGMQDQVNLVTKASLILAERLRIALGLDQEITQIVYEAQEQAREYLYPRLREAKLTMQKVIAEQAAADRAAEDARPRRKLGIDAVNEMLNTPLEENAPVEAAA